MYNNRRFMTIRSPMIMTDMLLRIWKDDGARIEENWLYEHTPDHEECFYQELVYWENEFDKYFDLEGLMDDGIDDSTHKARIHFLSEMESGEVSSIDEFAENIDWTNKTEITWKQEL